MGNLRVYEKLQLSVFRHKTNVLNENLLTLTINSTLL